MVKCSTVWIRGVICLIFGVAWCGASAQSVVIACKPDPGAFARADCSLSRGRHGQWVRGSANLLSNGRVEVRLGLETDSTFFGIGGKVRFDLIDADGKVIGTGSSGISHIPGKSPGKARIWESSWVQAPVTESVVPRVKTIRVYTDVIDDNAPQPWGISTWSVSMSFPTN